MSNSIMKIILAIILGLLVILIIVAVMFYRSVVSPIVGWVEKEPTPMQMSLEYTGEYEGKKITLGTNNCNIYKFDELQNKWIKILQVNRSLIFAVCTYEKIINVDDYIVFSLCKTPFGAGGGCGAGDAYYRTKDGINWENGTDLKYQHNAETHYHNLTTFKGTIFESEWEAIDTIQQADKRLD